MAKLGDFYKTNGLDRSVHEFHTEGPSMTRQEFKDECDINSIMARYDAYLSDPMASLRPEPAYVDFAGMPDTLLGAMEVFRRGEEAFMRLPAAVRKEFDNNAALFVDFASNPANVGRMREWGLAAPAPVGSAAPVAAPGAPGSDVLSPGVPVEPPVKAP